jgi:hypothetical protein
MIGLFIPEQDPGSGTCFFTHLSIPDPGVKKAPNPGSGSATLNASNFFDVQDSECDGGYSEPGRSGPDAAAVGARAPAAPPYERYSARAAAAPAYEHYSAPRHQSQLPRQTHSHHSPGGRTYTCVGTRYCGSGSVSDPHHYPDGDRHPGHADPDPAGQLKTDKNVPTVGK